MKNLVCIFLLLTSGVTQAQNVYSDQFQTLHEVETVEVIENANGEEFEKPVNRAQMSSDLMNAINNKPVTKNLPQVLMATKTLIAIGKEVYKVVEAGKPVLELNIAEPVSVLPKTADNSIRAMDLDNWETPKARKYRVRFKNYMGVSTVSLDYMVIFSYGGSYQGKGNFITGAIIKPVSIDVKWGWKLNASFKVQTIMNQGTDEDAVAGALLVLDYEVSTPLQVNSQSSTIFLNGLGKIVEY